MRSQNVEKIGLFIFRSGVYFVSLFSRTMVWSFWSKSKRCRNFCRTMGSFNSCTGSLFCYQKREAIDSYGINYFRGWCRCNDDGNWWMLPYNDGAIHLQY